MEPLKENQELHDEVSRLKHSVQELERSATESTQVPSETSKSETTFRELLETSADAILLQDETGAFVDCNQAALDLLKMTREQFINMTPDQISVEFQPNGRRSEEYAPEMTALGRKGFHRFEWTCKNFEGGEFVVEVSLMPMVVKGREMLHWTWRDITERKRVEAELRESETTFRTLLEASADAILLQDETAAFVDCNQAALDLLKMTREQFINMTPDQISVEFQPNGRRSEEYAPEMTALGRKGFHRFEWTCKNFEGGEFVVEVSLMPIMIKGREMLHCTWRDITERINRQNQVAEEKRLSEALNTISALLSSRLHTEDYMDELFTIALEAMGSATVALFLKSGDSWEVRLQRGSAGGLKEASCADVDTCPVVTAIKKGAPVTVIIPMNIDCDCCRALECVTGSPLLIAPIVQDGRVRAAIIFVSPGKDLTFSEVQMDFARKLAVSISMSSENARLYIEQQRVADTLQNAFLSMPDQVADIEFEHLYQASSDIARVGGDFYDLFELDDQCVGILLGDVSGHGLWATTFTAMVRNSIRAYVFDCDSPAQAMQKTNQLLITRQQEPIFVTVWCGVLDRGSGTLRYCSAGHPPAIVRRKSGGAETLREHSMMLGAIPGAPYSEQQVHLEVDDTLIVYSDGVTEARPGPVAELFGQERLLKIIEGLPAEAVHAIPPAILREILGYAGGRLSDDVAILALARK